MGDSFSNKTVGPIQGKCFISTRPSGKSSELAVLLRYYGADLLELPMIELSAMECDEACDDVLNHYSRYTHIAFTSAYGFDFFYQKISVHPDFKAIVSRLKIASIGYKTSETIRQSGLNIDFDGKAKTGAEFAGKLVPYLAKKNARLIWATGCLSPNLLMDKLSSVAQVTRLNLYKNTLPKNIDAALLQKIIEKQYDMIVLTSPSAFKNLFKITNTKELSVACIGRVTASEVERHGIKPLVIANEPSSKGIVEAILEYYKGQ